MCQCEGLGVESGSEDGGQWIEDRGRAQPRLAMRRSQVHQEVTASRPGCPGPDLGRYNSAMCGKNKFTAGFWTIAAVVMLLLLYPLSFGPACWLNRWTGRGNQTIAIVYRPAGGFVNSQSATGCMVAWYAHLGVERDVYVNWDSDRGPRWSNAMDRGDLSPLPLIWPFNPPSE